MRQRPAEEATHGLLVLFWSISYFLIQYAAAYIAIYAVSLHPRLMQQQECQTSYIVLQAAAAAAVACSDADRLRHSVMSSAQHLERKQRVQARPRSNRATPYTDTNRAVK